MLLLVLLVISVFASTHTYEFEYHSSFFDSFCKDRDSDPINIHFCEPFFMYFKTVLKPYPGIRECEVCESIVKEFRTAKEIKIVIENFVDSISTRFCDSLEVSVRENCKLWVPKHSGDIKTWLAKELELGTLCENLLNCKAKENSIGFMDSFYMKKIDKSYPFCKICINGVETIEKKFLRDVNFDEIVNDINALVCLNTPAKYYVSCSNLVHKIFEKIVEITLKFQNSKKLCSDIQLCSPTSDIDFFGHFPQHFDYKEVTSETLCDVCNNITTEEFKHFTNDASVAEWKKIGYALICNDLAESETCHTFVDMVMNLVVAQFKHILTKEEMCHDMLHCPSTPKPDFFHSFFPSYFYKSDKNIKNIDCLVCKAITHFFERTLKDPSTSNLVKFIYKLAFCGGNGEDLEKCIKTMDVDVPRIIDLISLRLRNKDLCTKMCTTASEFMFPEVYKPISKSCTFCKRIINKLKSSVGLFWQNEKWVELKVYEACDKAPVFEMTKCRELVTSNRRTIKRYLKKNYNASRICKELNKCPTNNFFAEYFDKDISHPHASYFHHFFDMFKSYPHKFYDMFSLYPSKFFDFYQSHPHHIVDKHMSYEPEFFDMFQSHPHSYLDVDKSYMSKFSDLYKSYDQMSSHSDKAYQFKFFDFFKSYPHMFFDFYKSYPHMFFEFFKSFPHNFFDIQKWPSQKEQPFGAYFEKEKTECEACKRYTEELTRLYTVYVSDPTFWSVFVDGMCKNTEIGDENCRSELSKYFETTFKIFDDGNSIETICNTSCKTFDHSIFMCVIDPKKYCLGNVMEQCGIFGAWFCNTVV